MENTLKTENIDIEKVKQLFDEILTYMLDNRYDERYARTRVQIADEIFKLTFETMELMYRTNIGFLSDCSKQEAVDKINDYRVAETLLSEIQKDIDILQA